MRRQAINRQALLLALALLPGVAFAQAGKPATAKAARGASPVLPGGNSKDPINIDADKLEWFDKDQKAIYTGKVVVVQGDGSMKSSALTIYMNKDEKTASAQPADTDAGLGPAAGSSQIKRMEAAGPVTIVQKDQVGTGDRGIYDKIENKVYLIGHVTLSQGANVTTGDKLIYDLDTKQAVVETGSTAARVKGFFVPGSGPDDKGPAKPRKTP